MASLFNVLIFLAAKAAKADDLMCEETIGVESVESSDDDDYDDFKATQDFNDGAEALAQELLNTYKE